MKLHQPECIWNVGATLGEGALWHARTQTVYFVDIKGRKIHACAADGSARRSWNTPSQAGFILPLAVSGAVTGQGDGFVCGLEDGLYQFSPDSGAFSPIKKVEQDIPSNRFNDGFVDAHGHLWFGSMDDAEYRSSGALYRLSPAGEVNKVESDYVITNGPAMSPDGQTLYHTDTLKKHVYAFDVLPDASLTRKRLFVAIQGSGYPDGMAVDAQGCVWIALFGGARIERYSAAGELLLSVAFPCSNVTKLSFGGDDLCTVFATTAHKGLSAAQRAQEPLAGALFSFRTETPGLAQHEFSLGAFA